MMAGIPKVKIQFDADLDGLKKGSKDAEDQVGGFAGKVEEFGKKAAAAFAVAAAAAVAYAGKLAIDGVKAAIEDEQAQLKLAKALETATGATSDQIKAVEDQILKTSLATGVADDKLRPALQRLAVATGDTEKAQKLLSLALDISTATGKPLEAVSNALGKAYEGNTSALAKLNVGISAADAKTLGYTGAVQQLTDLYGGAAAANADTYQGRIDRISVAFNEAKETIGAALLPILEKLLTFITEKILPTFEKFTELISGKSGSIVTAFESVVNFVKQFFEPIITAIKDAFTSLGETIQRKRADFDDILKTMQEVWAWIDKYLIPILQVTLVTAIQTAVKNIEMAINILLPVVKFILNNIKDTINGFIDLINVAIRAYNLFARVTFRDQIPLIGRIGEITSSGANLGSRPFGSSLSYGGTSLEQLANNPLTEAKIIAARAAQSTNGKTSAPDFGELTLQATQTFADALKQQQKSLETLQELSPKIALQVQSGTFPIPNDEVFDVARVRRGDEIGNTYNITVNGAIDPEAVSRQLVAIMNESDARGTVGANGFRFNPQVA